MNRQSPALPRPAIQSGQPASIRRGAAGRPAKSERLRQLGLALLATTALTAVGVEAVWAGSGGAGGAGGTVVIGAAGAGGAGGTDNGDGGAGVTNPGVGGAGGGGGGGSSLNNSPTSGGAAGSGSFPSGSGGAGGDGGTPGLVTSVMDVTGTDTITGSNGDAGANGNNAQMVGVGGGGGGGGGAGGYGVVVTTNAGHLNAGTITGGNGGSGGAGGGSGSLQGQGGGGGAGGTGVIFTNGGTFTNTGTVQGGNGGDGGTGSTSGDDGAGGTGIEGANLTVINSGTIAGGWRAGGLSRGNAITFTGGVNVLEIWAGSTLTGNVVGATGVGTSDTLRLGGTTDDSFDLGQIGWNQKYRNFDSFEKTGTSTWTLTGYGSTTTWTVTAGRLVIADSSSVGPVVVTGGTLSGTGTVSGIVANGGSVAPGNSIGTLNANGGVQFNTGSTFDVEISPTAADRLNVNGVVVITGGTLQVSPEVGTYTARTYDIITSTFGITGSFGTPVILNADRLAGVTLTAGVSGNNYVITLTGTGGGNSGGGGMFTPGSDNVIFVGKQITFDLDGLGSDDTVSFQGTGNTLRADIRAINTLEVGTTAGIRADLTLQSGGQTVTTTRVLQNATLQADGTLTSPTVLVAAGGTLGGSGTITGTVTNEGHLSPGASPGILTVSGAVTNVGDTSVFNVDVDGTTPGIGAGHHDQVVVTGTPGTFTAAGTIVPITRGITGSATNTFTPVVGDTFTIVTASGGVTGSFTGLTQPTAEGSLPAGTRFDVAYNPTSLVLAVTPAAYGNLAAAGLGQTENQRAAGQAIDRLRPAAGVRGAGDLDPVFSALYQVSGGQIGNALDQIGGALHADAGLADLGTRRLMGRTIENRLAEVRRGATTAGAAMAGSGFRVSFAGEPVAAGGMAGTGLGGSVPAEVPYTSWVQVLGAFGDHKGDGNANGFERRTGGALAGADLPVAADLRLGAALGYARTEVKAKNSGGEADLDSFQGLAYASWTPGALFVNGQLGYGFTRYDTLRPLTFGGLDRKAKADNHGHDVSAGLTVGRGYALDGWQVEPAVGLRYDLISRNGFSEEGAGALNLAVKPEAGHFLQTSVGGRVATRVEAGTLLLEPEANLAWTYDALDRAPQSRASLSGASFTVDAPQSGRHAAQFGAALGVLVQDNVKAYARYDGAWREHQTDHALTAGVRVTW